MALGSSFGDEVVIPLAKRQQNTITIYNANQAIMSSILRVIEDSDIQAKFLS
jgi:hypothetical protein